MIIALLPRKEWIEYYSDEDGCLMEFSIMKDIGKQVRISEISKLTKKYPKRVDYLRFLQVRKAIRENIISGHPDFPEL